MTDPEIVRKLTEKNKIASFAMQTLGCDERRAEVFVKACADHFVWDGTLRFKGINGEVPVDDDECTGFFEREYDFLLPPKKEPTELKVPITEELIASALDGNQTSRAQIFKIRGDQTPAETDKFLQGERAKLSADPNGERQRDTSGRFAAKSDNPWSEAGWNLSKQGQVYKSDPKLAERLAKAANSHIGAVRPSKAA